MATSAQRRDDRAVRDERAVSVRFAESQLVVDLQDGRTISTPVNWYPTLLKATDAQRANWRLIGSGYGIHWPDLDEDLSVEGMLDGRPAVGCDR